MFRASYLVSFIVLITIGIDYGFADTASTQEIVSDVESFINSTSFNIALSSEPALFPTNTPVTIGQIGKPFVGATFVDDAANGLDA